MNDEQRAFAHEQMQKMARTAPTKRDLAWQELKNGVDPKWVAQKYGFEVERMLAAKKTLDERAEAEIAKAKQ